MEDKNLKDKKLNFSKHQAKNVKTLEEATAYIANVEQIREAQDKISLVKSQNSQGHGHTEVMDHPLVLSRILQHIELVFNQKYDKNTHFAKSAGERWSLN